MKRTRCYCIIISLFSAFSVTAQQVTSDSIKVDSTMIDSTMVDSSQVESMETEPEPVDSVQYFMDSADEYAEKWDHENAIKNYLKVLEIDSTNYRAHWKLGDEYTELANNLPKDQEDRKEELFEKARLYSEKAIEINPDGFEGHLKLSTALGRLALFQGGKEKVKLSKKVKEEAEKALELNPESNIANHILGAWQQNVANLSGFLKFFAKVFFGEKLVGSNEEAVKYFKRAIELDPNYIEHYLELAKTYEYMDEDELQKEALQKVLELPATEEDDPKLKKEAKEMLEDLK
ncbi:MAG: tetratricopeptide repeat protein [bacterium]